MKHFATIAIAVLVAAAMIIPAAAAPASAPLPQAATCLNLEELPLGSTYSVGDVFSTSTVTVEAREFEWSSGQRYAGGYAEIDSAGWAAGIAHEVTVNNINLAFHFGQPLQELTLRFGEYGGNLNLEINGDFRNFEDFQDVNGANIGGVDVSVTNGFGNDAGTITFTGDIEELVIGGQELWLDDLCESTSPECVDFESLPLGQTYGVGDVFHEKRAAMRVTDFFWANGSQAVGGYAEISNGGLASGSGQELTVNNIGVAFFFGDTIPGLSLKFGEYGGNLNLEINGDFANFDNFANLNGAVLGGVSIAVTNGYGNDAGTLTLKGDIKTFSIGGQELWIDDVCPLAWPPCEPTVRGNYAGNGTPHELAYDGDPATYFESSHDNWQFIQIDFHCIVTFEGIQRLMTRDGIDTSGTRGRFTPMQGEGASYSIDGKTWVDLTGSTTSGWQGYVNYAPRAWHTLPYGPSATLTLNVPAAARYVRFNWDGDRDAVNEIDVLYR